MADATNDNEKVFPGGFAIMTVAGAGIGASLARRAGQLGMTVVVVTDISSSRAEAVASDIRAAGGMAEARTVDVSKAASLGELAVSVFEMFEKHESVRFWAFMPTMLESGAPGEIANLSSVGAFSVMPTQTAYIMTKNAVQSFIACIFLDLELKNVPISISCVIPGMLKTSIFEGSAGQDEGCKSILAQVAAKRCWVETQPEMTHDTIRSRVAFFMNRK
ncbi:hypothetical protein PSPO01_03230 [Paraphaeosphaeria sporulosa]